MTKLDAIEAAVARSLPDCNFVGCCTLGEIRARDLQQLVEIAREAAKHRACEQLYRGDVCPHIVDCADALDAALKELQ